MATETLDQFGVTARGRVALEASYEVDMISRAMLEYADKHRSAECDELLIRALGARLRQVAGVIMSALGDDGKVLDDTMFRLTGMRDGAVAHG